uniref:ADAM metallopeptidase with thrombospondin type 1 motif 14 n=1 Tax=Sinocyclocheilus grahami TaxID=75366 RepID=A0A672PEE4_SINGR
GKRGRMVTLNVFQEGVNVRLFANRRLVAPGAFVQWQEDFEEQTKERILGDCVFTGDVTDMPRASVAISNCDGLAGLIRTDDEEFFIEPLQKGQQEVEVKGRVHVVYRRSAIKRDKDQRRDDLHNEDQHIILISEDHVTLKTGVIMLEIQLHHSFLCPQVDEIYHDESLGTNINIVLVRMILVGYRQVSASLNVTLEHKNRHKGQFFEIEIYFADCVACFRLGMEHDGQGNRCSDETSMGSIMAPLVQAAFHRYHWSRCSKQELNRYIHSYDCLLDDPFELKWPKLTELPGINYSMDEQCRFDFGVGYKMCTAFRTYDPCKQLWCSHPDNQYFCKTKKGPPVDGTECAPGKWCFKGHCIWRSSHQPYGHDGGWSSWGKFGSCSRTCGGGVRSRSRQCNNPVPAYGGRDCTGTTFDYQVCNIEDCPGPYEDFRAQQCVQRSNKYHNNIKHTWLPYEHPDEAHKCELSCRSKETGEVVFMNQVMHDGTRCSYTDPFSVCARGECLVRIISCLSLCSLGLLKMFDIPAGARHIVIEENETSPHVIAVKNQVTGSFILNAKGEEIPSKTFIENGLEWEYSLANGKESLKSVGPLHEGIVVVPQAEDTKISLSYKYIIHEDLLPVITNNNVLLAELDTYEWALKSWSQCSKPCGGGVQYTKYGCRRKSDGRLVHRNFCEISKKPKPIRKRCNTNSCSQPTWVLEEWGPCSKSCGKLGYQSRVVQCMQPLHNGTNRPVHTKYCSEERPETRRACNSSACPSQWRTGAWSQCSVSCGEGIRQRQVVCSGQCDANKPESVSVCKLPPCTGEPSLPSPTKDLLENFTTEEEKQPENALDKVSNEPCLGDKSIFCQMEVLARYCSIPGYQKLCCESCNRRMAFSTLSPDVHPPFTWLPDFTFPQLLQTNPDPTQQMHTQTSVSPSTAAPLSHTTIAATKRLRPTSTSPVSEDESTSHPESITSLLPPDGLQNQSTTVDSPVT